jgi:thiol-disulfide isomerase/thioredoxin
MQKGKTALLAVALFAVIGGSTLLYNALRGLAPMPDPFGGAASASGSQQAGAGSADAGSRAPGAGNAGSGGAGSGGAGSGGADAGGAGSGGAGSGGAGAGSAGSGSGGPDAGSTPSGGESSSPGGESSSPAGEDVSQDGEDASQDRDAESRMKAPDFEVQDFDGNVVRLSDMLGMPVVLNFWASWCPPCKAEMPDFNKVYEELGGDVQFMMVNAVGANGETREAGADYVSSEGFSFPVYYDMEQDALTQYGIRAFPTSIFIDSEGFIVAGVEGAINQETLLRGINMIKS